MSKEYALILGVSSGIGAACATELAKAGINIIGLYMRKPKDQIEQLNNEADDLIATYVEKILQEGSKVTIVSSDKDLTAN